MISYGGGGGGAVGRWWGGVGVVVMGVSCLYPTDNTVVWLCTLAEKSYGKLYANTHKVNGMPGAPFKAAPGSWSPTT